MHSFVCLVIHCKLIDTTNNFMQMLSYLILNILNQLTGDALGNAFVLICKNNSDRLT